MPEEKMDRGPRSPGYPACDLKTAIDHAAKLKEYSPARKPIPIDSALKVLGYAPRSGGGMQLIASIKKYGLVEDSGSRDTRSVRLSDIAQQILSDIRPISPARDALLRKAALLPKINAEIRDRWPHGLPDESTIHSWLAAEKEFNEKAIRGFLNDLRATFEYAKLDSEPDQPNDDPGNTDAGSASDMIQATKEQTTSPSQPGAFPLPVLMGDGSFRVVYIPSMTEVAFDFFKKALDTYKGAIVRQDQPGKE